jgi:DNA polymerase III subunit chi
MTAIDFHTKVPDVMMYAARILRIAYQKGAKVIVFHDQASVLSQFNDQLWKYNPLEFIPHVMMPSPDAPDTPIVLAQSDEHLPHHQVLLNLSLVTPPFFSSFERLIEFVPSEGAALEAARQRYKYYKDHGYPLKTHDYREAA